MRLVFVRSREDGVGHYRCSIPALALRERGHEVDIVNGSSLRGMVDISIFSDYDAIIVQKAKLPQFFHHIRVLPEGRRPKVVWECDDLVTGLRQDNPSFYDYAPHAEGFKECIRLADATVFSTLDLAAHYTHLNPNWYVVPNCIDTPGLREWDIPERRVAPSDCTVIGWLGGIHHVRDEAPMVEGIRFVMSECPETVFAFCGSRDLEMLWKRSLGVRSVRWLSLPPGEFDGYQTRISQFDIGVAPLAQSEFNRCKSDLRLLEYLTWGVPYVASNIAPYRRFHIQSGGVGGCLCSNPEEWGQRLLALAIDGRKRRDMGASGREWVRWNRGNGACGEAWEAALSSIVSGCPAVYRETFPTDISRNTFCPCGSGVKYKRCCLPAWG